MLEDDLQQAVWRTILRGPRPPSAKWEKRSPPSAVSKSSPVSETRKGQFVQSCVARRGPRSGAREGCEARICIEDFGAEDDETHPILMAALEKAQSQAQERPIPDRIAATKSFLERSEKRVEGARQAVGRAKEELAKAEALLEKEEAMFKDGHQRLRQLLEEGEGDTVAFRTSSCSCWCSNRDQPDAGHHRQFAGRADQIARKCRSRCRCLRRRTCDRFATCQENQVGRRRSQQILGIDVRRRSCIWQGKSVRASLTDAHTSRCTARYGLRATRVGEASLGLRCFDAAGQGVAQGARLSSFRPMMNRCFHAGTWSQGSRPHRLIPSSARRFHRQSQQHQCRWPTQEENFHQSLLMSLMLWSMIWHHTQFNMWRRRKWMHHHLCIPRNSMLSLATPMMRRQVQVAIFPIHLQ